MAHLISTLTAKSVLALSFGLWLAGCDAWRTEKESPAPRSDQPEGNAPETPSEGGSENTPGDGPAVGELDTIIGAHEGIASAAGTFVVQAEWSAGPKDDLDNRLKLTFANAERQAPQTVTDVVIEPFMPVHGHGIPRSSRRALTITAREGGDSHIFDVSRLHFTMAGPWELRIAATVNSTADMAVLAVSVP